MADNKDLDLLEKKLDGAENTVEAKRVHKLFGEYKKCKITYKQENKKNVSIFASINSYTVECQQDTEVEIPTDIIEILKDSTYTTYFYDEKERKHKSKEVKKYFVELV